MSVRRIVLWLGVALVVAFVGRAAVWLMVYALDPHGFELRMIADEISAVNPPQSPMTDAHAKDIARVNNEIGRRSSWSDDDERWLLGILALPLPSLPDEPYSDERGTSSNLAWESYFLHTYATGWIGARLGLGVPTPEPIVEAFEAAVLVAMVHPHDGYRSSGMAAAWDAGWLDRPEVRAAFERIRDEDPEPRLRRVADRRLRHHDGLPAVGSVVESAMADEPCAGCPR